MSSVIEDALAVQQGSKKLGELTKDRARQVAALGRLEMGGRELSGEKRVKRASHGRSFIRGRVT